MQVRQAMTPNVVTVTPATIVAEAEELMHRGRFRHLPVVTEGGVVGVVSEREVRRPVGVRDDLAEAFRQRTVGEVMRKPAITVAPDDTVEDAARLLYENKIGCLPVVQGRELVGIITTTDVFAGYLRALGVLEPSTRVEVRADDLPAALAGIAEVAAREGAVIAGLATEHEPDTSERRVVVRFATLQGPRLVALLRGRGLDVAGPGED